MVNRVDREVVEFVYKIRIKQAEESPTEKTHEKQMVEVHDSAVNLGYTGMGEAAKPEAKVKPVKVEKKVGRNDPCPCGSGKKYKKCCGKES
ncbi:MAG: hypothetical protein GY855_03980 [candidate division Zixibacteria bacterium]|nr:hypothetical protein [candidate division Zixibacteria bacterium]